MEISVVVFAPRYRTFATPAEVIKVTFDEAANNLWAQITSDARLIYRSHFLNCAAQPNIVVVETENPFAVQWWMAVDEMARREFGDFFVIDRRRFPKTTYVNLKCAEMPPYLRLDLKGNQGDVALAFIGFPGDVLQSVVSRIEPKVADVVRKRGQDPTLWIGNLRKFQISDGISAIDGPVLEAYQAAHKLLFFWKQNRARFDEVAASLPLSRP